MPAPNHPERPQLDAALRALPDDAAPPGLLPAVLAAVADAQPRAWWRRSVTAWPAPARAAFLVGAGSLAACGCTAAWFLLPTPTALPGAGLLQAFAAPLAHLVPSPALLPAAALAATGLYAVVAAGVTGIIRLTRNDVHRHAPHA